MSAGGWMMLGTLLSMGLMMAGFGWLAATRNLPRNGWAGIRIPATMASDEAWAAGHRAAVPWLYGSAGGWLLSAGAVAVCAALGMGEGAQTVVGLVGLAVVGMVPLLVGTVVAGRAARTATATRR